MERRTADEYPQELLDLFHEYQHGEIDRRAFLSGAARFAVGGLTVAAIFESLRPNYAWAQTVPKDDPDLRVGYETVASPAGEGLFPPLWILSSSGHGAHVAAEAGAGLAFAWHINPDTALARAAADAYRRAFVPSEAFAQPRVLVAASVICAATQEEAEELSLPLGLMFLRLRRGETAPFPTVEEARAYPYTPQERAVAEAARARAIVGDPETVVRRLRQLARDTAADELMLGAMMPDPAARAEGYRLIMEAMRAAETQAEPAIAY